MDLTEDEMTLLLGWEDVYKKSQLTLWVLLALKNGPKFMTDIKAFIEDATNKHMQVDDKSMYRALRRFSESGLVRSTLHASSAGPKKKQLELTEVGRRVLDTFIFRNITSVINHPKNKQLFV